MRKYRLLIISATLLLPAWSRPEASQLRAYVETEAVIAVPGERSYIPVKIEIPAGYHIYANPKGPGTGRATELRAGAQKDFLFEPARYLPGKEYRAPGEKKPVFIYEKETRVFLPFTVREKTSPGERRISMLVESLLCGESTCIPLTTEIGAAVDIRAAGTPVETDSSLTALFMRAAAPGKSQPDAIPDKDNTGSRSAWPLSSSSFSPRYPGSAEVTGLFAAIIFGLIAGFLLNFMPCVLRW
jgi:thiol:disulfide interchange protein DsbD